MRIAPGPSVTTYIAGNRQNTRGKTSFTPSLAARSSARCRRTVRPVSACVRSACAMLVPKRSVWISIATRARTSSTLVRSAKLRNASMRGLPARISLVTCCSSSASAGCDERQLLARLQHRLIERQAGLDADDDQIERVGQAVADLLLPAGDDPADDAGRAADRRRSPAGCRPGCPRDGPSDGEGADAGDDRQHHLERRVDHRARRAW